MSWSVIRYVLTASIRDRLLISLFVILALGASLSLVLASSAIIEQDFFSAVFAGGGLRLAGVFGLILFVVFFVRRSFEAKDVEFLLARPISRCEFLLSYSAAFSILATLMAVAQFATLYALGPHLFSEGHILWGLSLITENIIMVNAALFFAMILSSASTAAMATLGLYVLSRMMGQILGIIDFATAGGALPSDLMSVLEIVMKAISIVIPRLDLMGQTSWLIYGVENISDYIFVFVQCFVFTALLLIASLLDLFRRQF